MHGERVDHAIFVRPEHVQWLTGARFPWFFQSACILGADGHCTLVSPTRYEPLACVDELLVYVAKHLSTLRNDQSQALVQTLLESWARRPAAARLGCEFSCCPLHLAESWGGERVDLEPDLFRLRRQKHPDELAMIRQAIAGTRAMYDRAREIVRPGVNELHVYSELCAAAVQVFGEPPTGMGNDFACGERGGAPRDRLAADGELYVLDLGPAYRGYFADNCRTLAVNGRPTDLQQQAWEQLASVFTLIDRSVRPGVSCREIFNAVQAQLAAAPVGVFNHHLGHGIGLFPHEAPHLNPNWDDCFQVGEVFTVEPGLYEPRLRAGIRLENDYLVTPSGVELLTDFALGL